MFKKLLVLTISLVLLASLILPLPVYAKQNGFEQFMVQFADEAVVLDESVVIERYIEQLNTYVLVAPRGYMAKYKKLPGVNLVEQDGLFQVDITPNDPDFPLQWGMTKIQADLAWDITTGSNSIIIAILDTGIDSHHPDLRGKVIYEKNLTTTNSYHDVYGHGTHCAGIAAAQTNNGIGVAGVGFNTGLANFKVLGDSGWGSWSWIADGIVTATDYGVDVISMSLGGTGYSSIVEQAVNYAWEHGVLLVAAAGNSGSTTPHYPAYYDNVLSVAASNNNDKFAYFSTYGNWVDVAAPGVSIWSTYPWHNKDYDGYRYWQGTSMACPHVAGLAGLLADIAVDENGNGFVNDEIRTIIETTTDEMPPQSKYIINGRINAYSAVQAAQPPEPPQPPPPTFWVDSFWIQQKGSQNLMLYLSVVGDPTLPEIGAQFEIEITKDGELINTIKDSTHPNHQNFRGKDSLVGPGVYVATITNLSLPGYEWDKERGVPLYSEIIVP